MRQARVAPRETTTRAVSPAAAAAIRLSAAPGARPNFDLERASAARASRRPTSLALLRRCSGSFARQPRSTAASSAPKSRAPSSQAGSRVTTEARTSRLVTPAKGMCPVSISHTTTPSAQMSARRSSGLPRACSGGMYAAVPRIVPARVRWEVSVGESEGSLSESSSTSALARPKSSTLTVPSGRTRTLAGLRSR